MALLAGIDLGTSSLKVVLLDPDGRVRGSAAADYPLHAPAPGVAEQAPEDWWAALRSALAGALARAGCAGSDVAAVGLSGQMHGIVALDGQGRPLRRAIIWADQRGADEVRLIEERVQRGELLALTGSRASVGLSAPKILWLQRREPQTFARCRQILLPKDYLGLRLTGAALSEPSDAAGTLLFDLVRGTWSDTLLERLGIPHTLLPPVVPSLAPRGALTAAAAAELGLRPGTPVLAGAGDTPCQAAAYGGLRPGSVLATLSSGGQLLAATGAPLTDPLGRVHTLCHVTPQRWYLLGAIQAAGLGLRWLRDLLTADRRPTTDNQRLASGALAATEDGGRRTKASTSADSQGPQTEPDGAAQSSAADYEALTAAAAGVGPGAGGLFFLPYLLGERTPHMDNDARAAFVGLSLRHGRPELTRAVLEGVAFAFRDGVEVLRELGLPAETLRLGGGGSRSPLWRQIMADVLGAPVLLTDAAEGAALGAALIAGVGSGAFRDLDEAAALAVRTAATIPPDPRRAARYDQLYGLFRGLYPSLREHFAAAARLGPG
jgi:xylulokinase